MGKTATSIGLILSSLKSSNTVHGGGDTLVVAPGHLILQWKSEIEKFTSDIEVLVGKREYQRRATLPPSKSHRVVLMDVDTVLNEEKLWYDFRKVFNGPRGRRLNVDRETMDTYRKAALFCVQSPRGPCSYEGWVYKGSLHLPFRPWRRVIFDEIQDLVAEGTESQKNLLQLSRTAKNVWLLSATPFPHGNTSVYANHELLGFCRLRMDVEVDRPLPRSHPFETIKRKLYIRSPKHVADEAVTASQHVTKDTIYVEATALERKFFELEKKDISDWGDAFGPEYDSLRQMMVHPEASKKLREQINGKDDEHQSGKSGQKIQQKNTQVGRFATVNSFARSSLAQAKLRHEQLEHIDIPNMKKELEHTRTSWYLALKIRQLRMSPTQANPFKKKDVRSADFQAQLEANAIHEYYCRCPKYESSKCISDLSACFQTMGRGPTRPKVLIIGNGATERIIEYFKTDLKAGKRLKDSSDGVDRAIEAIDMFISVKERKYKLDDKKKDDLEAEKIHMKCRMKALEDTVSVGNMKSIVGEDELAARHGSKSAALIRHLKTIQEKGEKTIVFSYWHDTLKLVWQSLRKCDLSASFCNGSGHIMSKAIADFTSGDVPILLLSAQVKASGANLQCATNIILLDPAGSSAEHGSTLETQAIGRAVRMGQENAVKVIRFCVKNTVEEELFRSIDDAAGQLERRSNDNSYTCEDAHKALDKRLTEEADEQEEPEEVMLGESISLRERISRDLEEAKAKDEIIVIDDSDDEDEPNTATFASPVPVPLPAARAKVKTENLAASSNNDMIEAASNKRPPMEIDDAEPSIRSDKRPRVSLCDNNYEMRGATRDDCPPADDTIGSVGIGENPDSTINAAANMENADEKSSSNQNEVICRKDTLSSSDIKWFGMLEVLKEIPLLETKSGKTRKVPKGSSLYKWCKNQQDEYKKYWKYEEACFLTQGRIDALNGIDFNWYCSFNWYLSSSDREWLDMLENLKETLRKFRKIPRGSLLEKWCKYQRAEYEKILKGERDCSLTQERIDALNGINFNWDLRANNTVGHTLKSSAAAEEIMLPPDASDEKDSTPQKNPIDATEGEAARLVSPSANTLETASISPSSSDADFANESQPILDDGLRDLLAKCKLEHYSQKFLDSGVSSIGYLRSKLYDIEFMEQLVVDVGLTVNEAIRFQFQISPTIVCI